MKKVLLIVLSLAVAQFARATTITAIFGSGNPDTGWTSVTASNVEIGLRAKDRITGATTNNGSGVYNVASGPSPANINRSTWNFEFSMNSDVSGASGKKLTDYAWTLSIDTDPTMGQSWISFNPFIPYADMSLGTNATANSAGVETGQFNLFNIAQNSENMKFAPWSSGYFGDATYDFKLTAVEGSSSPVEVSMQVVVGAGGSPVPDGGSTMALFASGLLGLGFFRRLMS